MDKSVITNYFQGNYGRFYNVILPDLKKSTASELKGRCPFHGDNDPSLSVNVHTGLFNCFGCGASGSLFDFYGRCNGLDPRRDLPKIIAAIAKQFCIHNGDGPMQTANTKSKVVARYDYQDQAGRVVYQIERLDPKSFRIRRSDENGGWIYKLNGTALIPYRLPEIIKNDDILIVEGEKDADNLAALGFAATTNPFGAGKWPEHFGLYFAGKNVVLIPDNDDPGRQHMKNVAGNLKGHAATIKWLNLPDLQEKGDVSDYIAQFPIKEDAAERLAIMIDGAPTYEPGKVDGPKNRFAEAMLSGGAALQAEIDRIGTLEDTIEDVLPESAALTVIYGPPGGGKSFTGLDWGLSIATGINYHEKKVKRKSVLYVAGEGQVGVLKRIKAWLNYHELTLDDLTDFHLLKIPITIDDNKTLREAINTIVELEIKPGVIILDTLARSMLGDENSTADMNQVVTACGELHEKTKAQIILIHHTGKDETKGPRGAIALTGATDAIYKTAYNKKTHILTLIFERQKDNDTPPPMYFRAELVETGMFNKKGKELCSLVMVLDGEVKEQKTKSTGLRGANQIAFTALGSMLKQKGIEPPDNIARQMAADGVVTPASRVVHEDIWRQHCYDTGISPNGKTQSAKKNAFDRAMKYLMTTEPPRVKCFDGYFWMAE